MHTSIDVLRQTRSLVRKLTDQLSDEELVRIPSRSNNNILWNMGHLAVTQQLLHYRLSGLEMYVPRTAVEQFAKGSSPGDWSETPAVDQVRSWLVELPERLAEDHAAGRFTAFSRYETSAGLVLENIETALIFNNFHEGIHVGSILALRRQFGA
jgi:hypothetical protein